MVPGVTCHADLEYLHPKSIPYQFKISHFKFRNCSYYVLGKNLKCEIGLDLLNNGSLDGKQNCFARGICVNGYRFIKNAQFRGIVGSFHKPFCSGGDRIL